MIITPSQNTNDYAPLPFNFIESAHLKDGIYYVDWIIGLNPAYTVNTRAPGLCRVFVPCGAKWFGIIGFAPQSVDCGLVLRYKTPPVKCDLPDWGCPEGSEGCGWTRHSSVSVLDLTEQRMYRKGDGTLQAVWEYFPEPLKDCGWLYVANVGMPVIKVAIQIDAPTFDAIDKTSWVGGNPPIVEVTPPAPSKKQQVTVKGTTDTMIFMPPGVTLRFKKSTPKGTIYKVIRS